MATKLGNHLDFQSLQAQNMRFHNLTAHPTLTASQSGYVYFNTAGSAFWGWDGSTWHNLSVAEVTEVAWSLLTGVPSTFIPVTEAVEDIVGSMVTNTTEISFSYNDTTGNITATILTIDASKITQSTSYRFVTDTQIATWNSKASGDHNHTGTYEPANTNIQSHISNTTNPHSVEKSDVGLGNVLNVEQVPASNVGVANGVASLDSNGFIPTSQLPGTVDEILEYDDFGSLPGTGEASKIYVTKDDNLIYRWGGSVYTVISTTLALGETSTTAYRGDRGKTAYDHSQVTHAPSNAQKNSDITKVEIEAKLTGNITSHTHTATVSSFKETIGNGSSSSFTISHNLGTTDVMVSVYEVLDGSEIIASVSRATINSVTVSFGYIPTTNQYRVIVLQT